VPRWPILGLRPSFLTGRSARCRGQAARAGLAALQVARFDVVLLDEPTNHLDAGGLRRLAMLLAARRGEWCSSRTTGPTLALATLGALACAVVYGTDVFAGLVLRPGARSNTPAAPRRSPDTIATRRT
jgi:hypothetical protein